MVKRLVAVATIIVPAHAATLSIDADRLASISYCSGVHTIWIENLKTDHSPRGVAQLHETAKKQLRFLNYMMTLTAMSSDAATVSGIYSARGETDAIQCMADMRRCMKTIGSTDVCWKPTPTCARTSACIDKDAP